MLIADSGSTKTEWREVTDGIPGKSYISSGLNPFFVSFEDIKRLLSLEMPDLNVSGVSRIYFYGTGVSNATKAGIMREAMGTLATPAKNPPIPTSTHAAVGGANCGATRWVRSANTAPVTPPMTSDGAKTPPEPPDEIVSEVARIFAGTSRSRTFKGSCSSSVSCSHP